MLNKYITCQKGSLWFYFIKKIVFLQIYKVKIENAEKENITIIFIKIDIEK